MGEPTDSGLSHEVLALMAHDLKNPLAAILANLHYLRMAQKGAEALEAIDDSVALCGMLDRFIGNLDIVARGDLLGTRRPTSLQAVAQQAVDRLRPQAQTAELVLEYEAEQLDGECEIDALWAGRALDNLISNALEHAPPRSVVKVLVRAAGVDEAAVAVVDEGTPIEPPMRRDAGRLSQTDLKAGCGGRYGRGLGLVAARLAGEAAGMRLELDESAGRVEHRFIARFEGAQSEGNSAEPSSAERSSAERVEPALRSG